MSEVTGLDAALAVKADQSAVDTALTSKADQTDLDTTNQILATKADADHEHFYGNMAVVATSGGEYADPVAAMADIGSWCGTPSPANPCLIRVMPGVYDLGEASLSMVSDLTLAGAGAGATRITGIGAETVNVGSASNVSLTDVTIENSADNAVAVRIGNSASVAISDASIAASGNLGATGVLVGRYSSLDLTDSSIKASAARNAAGLSATDHGAISISGVRIDVSSSSTTSYDSARGIYTYSYWYGYNNQIDIHDVTIEAETTGASSYGVMLTGYKVINGSAVLSNVRASAKGGNRTMGIMVQGPYHVTMDGVTAVGVDGTYNYGMAGSSYGYGEHRVEVMGGSFAGLTAAMNNGASSYPESMSIANTKIDGPIVNGAGGLVKCIGVFDSNFDPVVCP